METNQHRIYLAPFQGITTHIFREIYTRHFSGVDKLFTAFFSHVDSSKSLGLKAVELEQTHHNRIPVVPQILSKDANEIVLFGQICQEKDFEEINWNLGCPYPRVANKKRGSGMLPYPEMVREILEEAVPKLPLKLSIKCRLGYRQPEEILELMPVFNDFPLSELIIHARIGKQLYKGEVNLSAFEKAVSQSKLPVAYNGDTFSVEDFQEMSERFSGLDRWMLGRGLLADPFLPSDIKGAPEPKNKKLIIRKYVDDVYVGYRHKMNDRLQAINVMKEFWSYLSLSFDNPGKAFGKIKKCISFDAYEDAVNEIFENFSWKGYGGKALLNK